MGTSEHKTRVSLRHKANESLVNDLRVLLTVPPQLLEKLADIVNTEDGILVRDEDAFIEVWKETEMPIEQARDVVSVLKYLFETSVDEEILLPELLEDVRELCQEKEVAGYVERADVLTRLLTPRPDYQIRRKVRPFARGVVRNLFAISATSQIRAVFDSRTSDQILGYVPILQLRLTTHADGTEEEQDEECVFQLSLAGLNNLIRDLNAYRKQLEKVVDDLGDSVTVFRKIPGDKTDEE